MQPINDSGLAGRTALVTGATAGIGRAVALTLAAHGAEVVVHGRDPGRTDAVVAEIVGGGGRARPVVADLADAREVRRLAVAAGDVDLLVNNAGIYTFASTPATSLEDLDRQFAVNTRAPFLLVAALAPAMAERGSGAVINISSTSATSPAPIGAAYGASKAAIELLTRSWATEFGPDGVRVNAVSPGPVHTEGTTRMLGDAVDQLGRVTARGRAADPREIAEIVAFLADDRSSYVNGAVLLAHGGERALVPA